MNIPERLNSSVVFSNPGEVADAKTEKFSQYKQTIILSLSHIQYLLLLLMLMLFFSLLIVGDYDIKEIVERFMHLLVPNGILVAYTNYIEVTKHFMQYEFSLKINVGFILAFSYDLFSLFLYCFFSASSIPSAWCKQKKTS